MFSFSRQDYDVKFETTSVRCYRQFFGFLCNSFKLQLSVVGQTRVIFESFCFGTHFSSCVEVQLLVFLGEEKNTFRFLCYISLNNEMYKKYSAFDTSTNCAFLCNRPWGFFGRFFAIHFPRSSPDLGHLRKYVRCTVLWF